MIRSPLRLAFVPLLLCLFGGCGESPTQLVVVASTDLTVPDPVSTIRIRTLRADADVEEELTSQTISVTAADDFPVVVAVEPIDPMELGRVMVEVEAQNAMGVQVVARRATTEFVAGRQLELPIFLPMSCRRVSCPSMNTCTEMGCASQEVPASGLQPFSGTLSP